MDNNVKIIERIRKGDESAFEKLLENHKKMIYSIINSFVVKYNAYSIEQDDLYQEGCLALYDAAISYEADKETKFSSYAYLVIRSKIINVITKYNRIYNRETFSIDSFECAERSRLMAVSDVPFKYHRDCELKRGIKKFMSVLSEEDRKILELRYREYTYREISEKLDIHTKKVDNRLSSIRKALRCCMDESEFI